MKKFVLILLFFTFLILGGCDNKSSFENNTKCQEYLGNFKQQFGTGYKNFSVFFSKKLDTCIASYEYEQYEFISPWSRDYDIMYFVQDVFDKSSICTFANRKRIIYPDSITNDSNYYTDSEIKICNCENILPYNEKDINLCNLGVGNIRALRGYQIEYLK